MNCKENTKQTIGIRFEKKTLTDIEEIAKKKKRKKTELIRIIVEDYLEKYTLMNS